MGNLLSEVFNDIDTQKQLVSLALVNAINEVDLLLGLHSAAEKNFQRPGDINEEIEFYTQKISRFNTGGLYLKIATTNFANLPLNIQGQLHSVYLNCAASLSSICKFILKNAKRTDLYDHVCNNRKMKNALFKISEAKIRCIIIRDYLPRHLYNHTIDADQDLNLVTAKIKQVRRLPTEEFLKPFLKILCNELLYEKQLEFVYDAAQKSLAIDLAMLCPAKSNSCLRLNRALSNVIQLNNVYINNIDFSLLQRDVIYEICEILQQVEIVKTLVVNSVSADGKAEDVAAVFRYISSISQVKNLELSIESKAAYTTQVELEFNQQQIADKIANSALSEMRLQIMNVARPYEPQLTYKQTIQSIHDSTGMMFKSLNFLYHMNFRAHRLHPATIHALYLRSVVLNNDVCESIFKPNLESHWEQVTVKCDDRGVIEFHNRDRAVIDAAVLTRFGATYLNNSPCSELQVVKRCTLAPRDTLILYRQKLDELTHDWGFASLKRLDYFDAVRSVASILSANNANLDNVAKNILSFLCPEQEQRKFEYQPLRLLYDKQKYKHDGSELSGCTIF